MLLRPATPLSILFGVAFVLLLLSTLSTPVIKAIPLATFNGVDFGVFGACKGSDCTSIKVGYNPDSLLTADEDDDFSLPSSARHSLSAILIVHPIAAFLALICFCLSLAAHFHSPAHSPRYLLALLILSFPTLLVSLLAFLVDILLFVPHMSWGGWIVLAATVLIVASGVVTCAMRRTLVSRKARKKRIEENAEMNGQNYYENRDAPRLARDEDDNLPRADSPPPMADPKMPQYATFETASSDQRKTSDDREPLNPRAASLRSVSTNGTRRMPPAGGPEAPPMPGYENAMQQRRPSRDQYGNPLPPAAVAMEAGLPPPGLRHHASRGSVGSQGSQGSNRSYGSNRSRGAPPGYRGRGGYPQRGGYSQQRGGFPPQRGGYGPRAGYGPGPRGNMAPGSYRGGPQGMRGGPLPGYAGPRGAAMMMNKGPSNPSAPPEYEIDNYYSGEPDPVMAAPPAMAMASRGPRTASPGPNLPSHGAIGQAIEMDERHGMQSPPLAPQNGFGLRDSDGDVAGIVALQEARSSPAPGIGRSEPQRAMSPPGMYGEDRGVAQQAYVPPRSDWNGPPPAAQNSRNAPAHHRTNSDHYYEDVNPRFAQDEIPSTAVAPSSPVPTALTPGGVNPVMRNNNHSAQYLHPNSQQHAHNDFGLSTTGSSSDPSLPRAGDSYENLPEGARSPADSDASHFTSISQRGVNPAWRPVGPSGPPGPMGPPRAAAPRKNDMILGANPDFMIPGMRPSNRGGRGGPRGVMAGPMRGGPSTLSGMPGAGGMSGQGRYPGDVI